MGGPADQLLDLLACGSTAERAVAGRDEVGHRQHLREIEPGAGLRRDENALDIGDLVASEHLPPRTHTRATAGRTLGRHRDRWMNDQLDEVVIAARIEG